MMSATTTTFLRRSSSSWLLLGRLHHRLGCPPRPAAFLPSLSQAYCSVRWSSTGGTGGGGDSEEGPKDDLEKANKIGHFKSPIVKQLWRSRALEKDGGGKSGCPVVPRKPSDSRTRVTYEFSNDDFLKEGYINPWGYLRKGRLFEDFDAFAGTVSYKHCKVEGYQMPMLVTACVDRIHVSSDPKVEEDMEMSGEVVWTGTSSLEVKMQVAVKGEDGELQPPWVEASFTFVARDPRTGRATKVNPLIPETEEEKEHFAEVESRNQARKARRERERAGLKVEKPARPEVLNKKAMMDLLIRQANPLKEMPCLADVTCVLINHTRLQNSLIMQPQQRNMMNRIFGGFLMRRAYELGYATAYLFGGSRPVFTEVARIDFVKPVNIGDLVRFDACVLYTRHDAAVPEIHVQVEASVCRPEQADSQICTNVFFTFRFPNKPTVKKVLPSNYDQAKKMVDRIEADLLAAKGE